jgi:DNA-binding LytR/AlgR family response regulator
MQHQPISVIIIEDEEIWSTQLELCLKDLGFNIAGIYSSAAEALANIGKLDFDIALLDINMEGHNVGITLGKMIHYTFHKPFIFITGSINMNTAAEAIEAKPSAYLIKPVNDTSLFIAINTALNNFHQHSNALPTENNNDFFFIKAGNRYKKIEWADVVALQSERKYTKVLLKNDASVYLLNSTLKKAKEVLIPLDRKNKFVQINRAEIVNIDHIDTLKEYTVFINHMQFEATDSYIKELKTALHII